MSSLPLCLNVTKNAQNDIRDILTYTYEEWGAAQAEKYRDLIFLKLNLLTHKPRLGRRHRTESNVLFYTYKIGAHIAVYDFSETDLWVMHLFHERMDIPTRLNS